MFAGGKAAAILDTSDQHRRQGQAGASRTTSAPSRSPAPRPGKTQPVFLGGSDLVVAAKSHNQDLALAYLKAAADPAVQRDAIVGIDGWTPVSTELIDQITRRCRRVDAAFLTAAKSSVAHAGRPGLGDHRERQVHQHLLRRHRHRTQADRRRRHSDFDAHLDQALNAR